MESFCEKSSGHKLKALRTDSGGEFISNKFQDYLKAEGVKHELTVPKTPEQNGVAERQNTTLVESVRAMLTQAKLPKKFWVEALNTAVYLRNRSSTKAVNHTTPFEAWTGDKPDVSHLRSFGRTAYAHIPEDERKKLDSKARKCIFLGYGTETKGYRLYDCERKGIFYSRDVKFNESEFGIEKEPCHGPDKLITIELSCDDDVNDRKSTSGYTFQMNGASVSWRSKKQPCVALSIAEAEYIALSAAVQEALWLKQLLVDLNVNTETPVKVFEDNKAAISMTKNPQYHGRAKHVDIKYHFVRDHFDKGNVCIVFCPTSDMLADIFTKGLARAQFIKLRELVGLTPRPRSTQ